MIFKIKTDLAALLLIGWVSSCGSSITPTASNTDTVSVPSHQMKVHKPECGFYCGFLDSKGLLWFGTRGEGVYQYDGTSFTHFTEKDGLSSNDVSCIAEDHAGHMWFGTPKGACRYDRKHFSHLNIPQSDTSSIWLDQVYPVVNPNQVMSILEDSHGHLWIGTNGAGVYWYDGNTFTQHLSDRGMVYEDGLHHNIVLSMIEDKVGNVWFTSLSHGGVSRFDGTSFTHFMPEDGLSDDFVRTIFCDRSGDLWVGTHGNHQGGFDRFDGERFTRYYKTDDGFLHNNVRWIYEDKDGALWLGSGTTPLSVFDGAHFRAFTSQEGQTFDKILFVVGDTQNRIWFGGREGLWKVDGSAVVDMMN